MDVVVNIASQVGLDAWATTDLTISCPVCGNWVRLDLRREYDPRTDHRNVRIRLSMHQDLRGTPGRLPACAAAHRETTLSPPHGPAQRPHPKGGPLPTLYADLHAPGLAAAIQQARGHLHDGDDPLPLLRELGQRFGGEDLALAGAYLCKAADSHARMDVMRTRREIKALQAEGDAP